MNTIQAIQELCQYDHCVIGEKTVLGIYRPFKRFGVKPKIKTYIDNRSEPKGLCLDYPYQEGDSAEGLAAEELATDIADQLGVKYRVTVGRGSQLRFACEALLEYFEFQKSKIKKSRRVSRLLNEGVSEVVSETKR